MDVESLIADKSLGVRLEQLKARKTIFSDIVDDQGLQYVDLVMEGGGMLGIALVGYTWALEQVGIRFLGVGGTSAGSINALLLAALGTPAEPKSPKLLELLAELDFFRFVDGDDDVRDLIKTWAAGAGALKMAFKGVQVIDTLRKRMGLNPGEEFRKWMAGLLKAEGIRTLNDLEKRINTVPPGLRSRLNPQERLDTPEKAGMRLAIVAADVSTETKAVFPDDADLYFRTPDAVNPAVFVRASMSIPYFFEPYHVSHLPTGPSAARRWLEKAGYDASREEGGVPKEVLFVDGGIMSNFPIDLFHDYGAIPLAPTFGVKLQYDCRRHFVDSPLELFGAIFNSARHCLDYDFIHRNPDYRMLVQWIPCQGYNWLDFSMSDEHKAGLFREGALKAIEFLERFDWAAYKALRAPLVRPAGQGWQAPTTPIQPVLATQD